MPGILCPVNMLISVQCCCLGKRPSSHCWPFPNSCTLLGNTPQSTVKTRLNFFTNATSTSWSYPNLTLPKAPASSITLPGELLILPGLDWEGGRTGEGGGPDGARAGLSAALPLSAHYSFALILTLFFLHRCLPSANLPVILFYCCYLHSSLSLHCTKECIWFTVFFLFHTEHNCYLR